MSNYYMSLNTLDVKLTPKTGINSYNAEINGSTLEILSLILEFKLASAKHVSRFLSQKERSRHIYAKLRRMWQAGLLESFKILSGDSSVLFFMLSKQGLRLLSERGLCGPRQTKNYPKAKSLLSWGLFKHEAQIIELASLESMNKTDGLTLTFRGEEQSQEQDYINDKPVEALTPDYTVLYKTNSSNHMVFTEFERTRKSNDALLNKIQRYMDFLPNEAQTFSVIRLIFQTQSMERAFWLNIVLNRPTLLHLNIVTTNLEMLTNAKRFLEPVYAAENTMKLNRDVRLQADLSQRIKLFDFL